MVDPVVIRGSEVDEVPPPGASSKEAGWMKRIVYPPHARTKGTFMGVSEIKPGFSIHRWHRHTSDKAEGYSITYPEDFEEIYHIVRGKGVVQWKTGNGKISEKTVAPGDTLWFPADVAEHQLLNTGPENMYIVFCGSPTPKVTTTYK